MAAHIVGKILDVFGIEFAEFKRWNPDAAGQPPRS
jgi:3-polyprenyl-4-hydroxybenzoate decarboxylase